MKKCPFCGAEVDTVSVKEKDENLNIKVKRKDRWIPVEDALPENKCGVIFTVDRGHPFVCAGYRINVEREGLKLQRWFDKLSGLNFSDYDVKARMPMPDAYEPEKEDENE